MPIPTTEELQEQLWTRISEITTELSNLGGLVDSMEGRTSITVSATRMSLLAERKQLLEELAALDPGRVVTRYSRAV